MRGDILAIFGEVRSPFKAEIDLGPISSPASLAVTSVDER
jgi:hypothetical protein